MKNVFVMTCALLLACPMAQGEQRWKYSESKDDISGKAVRVVAVVGEDNKSVLVLRAEEGKKATITIVPSETIFPDKTHVASKTMAVRVTFRSSAMSEPKSGLWQMAWMDYKSASAPCSKKGATDTLFAGDTITIQFDSTGKRCKFVTAGEDAEGLKEAVAKAIEIAADEPGGEGQ